jgi:hypothetical protein
MGTVDARVKINARYGYHFFHYVVEDNNMQWRNVFYT